MKHELSKIVDSFELVDLIKLFLRTLEQSRFEFERVKKHAHLMRQYKVLITPTMNIFQQATYEEGNHILREHAGNIYHFIRVQFADDSLDTPYYSDRTRPLLEYVRSMMQEGLRLGNRCLKFIGYSNSQLKQR